MELFRLLGTIALDNSEAIKALDDTSKKASDTGTASASAFEKIGSVAKRVGTAVVTAGVALGGAWVAAIEGTREYRTQMGMLDTAFQTSGHSSETARKTFSELNAVLGDSGQATEASQHLAKLTDNEKDLETWTNICTGVFATFGEALPIEGLTEASNETAKTGILTGGLVDALNWAGISEEKFQEKLDACSTEQERQKLIMDTLNGSYSDASEQYKKTNKDVLDANKAQEKLTNAFAELGRIGEPILTAIKEKVAELALAAIPHIQSFVDKIKDLKQWIQDNETTINTWVGVIIGAGAAIGTFLLILNWGAIMTAAANAINVVRTAILAMNMAMYANPVGLVVAAIVGLVAAFIYLWNTSDTFRAFWINLWEIVKSAASVAWSAITKFFSEAWTKIKKTWSAVSGYFKNTWSSITKAFANVKTWFSNTFRNAWNGVKSIWNGAKAFFRGIWTSVTGVFSNVVGWFRGKFSSAWTSIKNVFSSWGSFFGGLWTKIKDKFGSIGTSLGKAMGDSVKTALNKVLAAIEKTINGGIGLINKVIGAANKLPGVDVGKVDKVSLPRLEKGGILERGQVGLLEGSAAEAVVPLEKNRAWLTRLAAELNQIQQGYQVQQDNTQIQRALNQIISLLETLSGMTVRLDSGTLVGALIPGIDMQLADRWSHAVRGNTR